MAVEDLKLKVADSMLFKIAITLSQHTLDK